jgi:hypothetical protein
MSRTIDTHALAIVAGIGAGALLPSALATLNDLGRAISGADLPSAVMPLLTAVLVVVGTSLVLGLVRALGLAPESGEMTSPEPIYVRGGMIEPEPQPQIFHVDELHHHYTIANPAPASTEESDGDPDESDAAA